MRYYSQMLRQKNRKAYLILLTLFITCFLLRVNEIPLPGILMSHISNFAITGGLFMLSSDSLLLNKPFSRKRLLLELLPFAILNIVIELFVRVDTIRIGIVEFVNFNTPDVIDMVFGLLSLVLVYFVIINTSVSATDKK